MSTNLNKIRQFFLAGGYKETTLDKWQTSSVYLSSMIMEYAHQGQKRANGEDYAMHPTRACENYRNLIGYIHGDLFSVDVDLLLKHDIPYHGVQEVCLLHDVVEDTDFTIEDVREIFYECGFKDYFEQHICIPLLKVTHTKEVDYQEYMDDLLNTPAAAMVKMMDLQDNLRVIDLTKFNTWAFERAERYLKYIKQINDRHHFLEKVHHYRKDFNKAE